MTSFENTKSSITGSALGSALSMTSNTSWSDIVTKIKGVTTKTSGSQSINTSSKYGFDTTYGPWMYIPVNGYYTTSHWLNIPWNIIKGSLGDAGTGNVLSGKTFTSTNGVKLTGTMISHSSHTTITESGKWGIDSTDGAWLYIPENGYYTTSHWLNIPWSNVKSKVVSTYASGTGSVGTFVTLGFQPNMIVIRGDVSGTNFPVGVYCSFGQPMNVMEGQSQSHYTDVIYTNSTGFGWNKDMTYISGRAIKYVAAKIV